MRNDEEKQIIEILKAQLLLISNIDSTFILINYIRQQKFTINLNLENDRNM